MFGHCSLGVGNGIRTQDSCYCRSLQARKLASECGCKACAIVQKLYKLGRRTYSSRYIASCCRHKCYIWDDVHDVPRFEEPICLSRTDSWCD